MLVKIIGRADIENFSPITANNGIRRRGGLQRIDQFAKRIDLSGVLLIDMNSEARFGQTEKLDSRQRVGPFDFLSGTTDAG